MFKIQQIPENWEKYLIDLEKYFLGNGYRRIGGHVKNENFGYWKTFEEKYQIAVLVYDWRKYKKLIDLRMIGIQYECMPKNIDFRCDLSVSYDIELLEFEAMAKTFYNAMEQYFPTQKEG